MNMVKSIFYLLNGDYTMVPNDVARGTAARSGFPLCIAKGDNCRLVMVLPSWRLAAVQAA